MLKIPPLHPTSHAKSYYSRKHPWRCVPLDRGYWPWGLGSGPALDQNTPHWALAVCFSFVVGVWGGGWGREGRAILGFWFVPY